MDCCGSLSTSSNPTETEAQKVAKAEKYNVKQAAKEKE